MKMALTGKRRSESPSSLLITLPPLSICSLTHSCFDLAPPAEDFLADTKEESEDNKESSDKQEEEQKRGFLFHPSL
jgi:hypothetical protein